LKHRSTVPALWSEETHLGWTVTVVSSVVVESGFDGMQVLQAE